MRVGVSGEYLLCACVGVPVYEWACACVYVRVHSVCIM